MIFIVLKIFEFLLSLLLINYATDFYYFELPLWTLLILVVYTAFVISKVKIHFTFLDALQIPVMLLVAAYIAGIDLNYYFYGYGNIPLYVGIIGAISIVPGIHASLNYLKKV